MKTANRFLGNDLIAIPLPKIKNIPIDDDKTFGDEITEKDESDKQN